MITIGFPDWLLHGGACKRWQCVKNVVNMKNITHVVHVINTYVSTALIQFILVLMQPDPVIQ